MTELLTPHEVAVRLKITVRTVRIYIQDGIFPNVKRIRDGSYRIPDTDLARYLDQCGLFTDPLMPRPISRRVISRGYTP